VRFVNTREPELWTFVRQMQEAKPFTIVQNIPGNKLGSHIAKLNNSVVVMMNTNFTGWDLEYMVSVHNVSFLANY
jgi:hypothetical protein